MEMKYVVPDMAQSFGTLEFAGESDHVFDRDKDNRRFFARRSYNLYSDVQKGENVVVEIPVQAGEKKFKYEQKVKLVNPVADTVSRKSYTGADVDWYVKAEDIVLKNKGNQNAGSPQNPTPQGQPKKQAV